MKKAFLVTANVTTRVVIDVKVGENNLDDYEKIIADAKQRLLNNLSNDYEDCIEDVRNDVDCPYNSINDDMVDDTPTYVCPNCGETLVQGDWNYNYDTGLLDFECPICLWSGTENEVIIEND
jgi:predicted RNA-binding Zn-ribbon protein involved in translation (DUF1610 family)